MCCGLDLVVTWLNLKMQVHAQVRTWNPANNWNQEFRDDRDFDFFKKNLSQMIYPVWKTVKRRLYMSPSLLVATVQSY